MIDAAENNSTGVGNAEQNTQPQEQQGTGTQTTQNTESGNTEGKQTTILDKVESPQTATTYNFKDSIPQGFEFSQEQSDKFADVIKDMHLSNEQANAIAKYGFEWGQGLVQQAQAAFQNQFKANVDGWGEETKKAYGSNFDGALAHAGQAIEYLERNGVPNIRQMFGITGAGSRVEMLQMLEVVSKLIESDPGKGMTGTAGGKTALDNFYNNSNFNKL